MQDFEGLGEVRLDLGDRRTDAGDDFDGVEQELLLDLGTCSRMRSATDASSPVRWSTRASSHSAPTVDRSEGMNSNSMGVS